MPSEKLEKSSKIVMQKFKMEADIPQNNSQQELVRDSEEICEQNEKTLKDVKFREWVAVFVLCFVNLINYMDRFTIAGILIEIKHYFDIKDDKAGLLQTAFVISYMGCAPLFGYLGDRYSRRWIMAAGVFLWSITTLCGSFMTQFWWFILFRALVGVGEASYSTIAPTIISDLFVSDVRSKMLALFYFAIPVGSGMGYIVGSETAKALGKWQWALRVTPALGLIAVVLIVFILEDPERGQSEGSGHMEATPWTEDIKDIVHNRSFMFSTAGFTCVAFVAGALAWWGPNFIELGLKLQDNGTVDSESVAYKFGIISMISGLIGVPVGSLLAQKLRHQYHRIDAHICAVGLLVSSPLVFFACLTARYSAPLCFTFVFFAEFFLNLTWSIVADILLYVVLPTRRSTAEGFQLLVSHALGDAGSPYLIGVVSIREYMG
ncbi:protein spinster [Anoplophora glabripennis]|uniref:protein spinster n=1 Tax=Anoplophora glabripennis TaxID=217634 RepID=UPI0008737514|nr:protein spinster [Anoplophora glabripennis]